MIVRLVFILMTIVRSGQTIGTTLVEGEVYIQAFASVYKDAHPNGSCYNINTESVLEVEALRWTIEQINMHNPNSIKIGLRVSQTCVSARRAEEQAFSLAQSLVNDSSVVGVIGGEYSSETEVISRLLSSLPAKYRLPQIAFSTTAYSLRNKDIYRNFFRVVPPDDIQVEVMGKLLQRLNWTYIAVFYDDDAYGRDGVDRIRNAVESRDICFPVEIHFLPGEYDTVETKLRDNVFFAPVPVSGVLVFGSLSLALSILNATEDITKSNPNVTSPAFLFSEASSFLGNANINVSRGSFTLSPARRKISTFETYLAKKLEDLQSNRDNDSNLWLRQVYEYEFKCKISLNNCSPKSVDEIKDGIGRSMFSQYAVQAAMVLSKVIIVVHKQSCGDSSSAACQAMLQVPKQDFINVLQNITVSFDTDFGGFRISEFRDPNDLIVSFNGSEVVLLPSLPLYEVYNMQICNGGNGCPVKVATLEASGDFKVSTDAVKDYDSSGSPRNWPNIRKPQCPDGFICEKCLRRSEDQFLFIEGDLYLVGVVPVHNKGISPLICSSVKAGSLDVVEAIRFAVDDAKSTFKQEIPNVKIGILIIDSCNDPHTIQEKILSLHRFGVYVNGSYKAISDRIIGYIGGWASDSSIALAGVTTRLGYPQISYASTATTLSKRTLYPYFLRVPSPDSQQVRTMLNIVQTLDSNLIQIAYSDNSYGEGAKDLFVQLSKASDICIAQTISIQRHMSIVNIVNELRLEKDARIVILFVDSFGVDKLAESLNNLLRRNEFLFIASEGWGRRGIKNEYRNLIGTITLTSELSVNDKFNDHLKELSPDRKNSDPWLREYMETYFDCYYQWSFNKSSNRSCKGTDRLDALSGNYAIDGWMPFAYRATVAMLLGSKTAMNSQCGTDTHICKELRNSTEKFVESIRNVKMNIDNRYSRLFDDNGDGVAGYQIYVISLDNDGLYRRIGSNDSGGFTFQKSKFYNLVGGVIRSRCDDQEYCKICFPTPPLPQVTSTSISSGAVTVIVLLSIACCGLLCVLLYVCNKFGFRFKKKRNGEDPYLSPVYTARSHEDNYFNITDLDSQNQARDGFSGGGISGGGLSNRSGCSCGHSGGTITGFDTNMLKVPTVNVEAPHSLDHEHSCSGGGASSHSCGSTQGPPPLPVSRGGMTGMKIRQKDEENDSSGDGKTKSTASYLSPLQLENIVQTGTETCDSTVVKGACEISPKEFLYVDMTGK